MTPINPALYEMTEEAILSGQVEARDLIAMLAEDDGFAEWYRERIKERQSNDR